MKSQLFIPEKIKIGFNKRSDTFTGKLGFVIYQDEKKVWRQQKSWEMWCQEDMGEVILDNKPTSGFILSRDIQRDSYHFGSGRSIIRVYHPEGFEFEIDCSNLLGIIANCDISKRDIAQECVFAWSAGKLILLPVNSLEYKESMEYTLKQSNKIDKEKLKEGFTYTTKKNPENLIYIGHLSYNANLEMHLKSKDVNFSFSKAKKHVFYSEKQREYKSVTPERLSECIIMETHENYAKLYEKYINSVMHTQKIDYLFEDIGELSYQELKRKNKECLFVKHVGNSEYILLHQRFIFPEKSNFAERIARIPLHHFENNKFTEIKKYWQNENIVIDDFNMMDMLIKMQNPMNLMKEIEEHENRIASKFTGWLNDFNFIANDTQTYTKLIELYKKHDFKLLSFHIDTGTVQKTFK